jgi:hypothetical protein
MVADLLKLGNLEVVDLLGGQSASIHDHSCYTRASQIIRVANLHLGRLLHGSWVGVPDILRFAREALSGLSTVTGGRRWNSQKQGFYT